MGQVERVKMGQWVRSDKDVETKLNLKQEQVQGCKPWVICHKHTQMVEMIMTNESQTKTVTENWDSKTLPDGTILAYLETTT